MNNIKDFIETKPLSWYINSMLWQRLLLFQGGNFYENRKKRSQEPTFKVNAK